MLCYTYTAALLQTIISYKSNNVVQQIIFFHAVYHVRSSDHQHRKPERTEVLYVHYMLQRQLYYTDKNTRRVKSVLHNLLFIRK